MIGPISHYDSWKLSSPYEDEEDWEECLDDWEYDDPDWEDEE